MKRAWAKAAAWSLGAALGLPLLGWALAVLQPGAPPATGHGPLADRLVLAASGQTLANLAHAQRRAGPWLGPGEIPPLVAAAARAAEDRRLDWHPGVDPLALGAAMWSNLRMGRVVRGGSTIAMQVARLEDPGPRTLSAKLREAGRALWLRARLGGDGVLAQYVNRAPFGGPLVGISAAGRELLGKGPDRLNAAEAALLLALPQDPARLLKPSQRPRLTARRNAILRAMARAGDLDQAQLEAALGEPVAFIPPPPPPVDAPHFARSLARALPEDATGPVRTYLEADLQEACARLAAQTCARHGERGLRQAAVLVLRNSDRAVLAWVGSPDFGDPEAGQVDGVLAKRQPGSALKPFLYALALEQGRTLASVLQDAPFSAPLEGGGTLRPVDYDREHRGPVSLRVALASSLNLPALSLAREISPAALLTRLREAGLALPLSAETYGMGLALGNGEVSLLELTQAYAALATGGLRAPARLWRGQEQAAPEQVFAPQAAALVSLALADDQARSMGFGRHGVLELPFPAAVKTGTSQHHRDNWCLGFTADYTVGVWAGNFQAQPMRGLSGVSGAAPLWRQVMLLLHRLEPGGLPPLPPGLTRAWICPASGQAATPFCPTRQEEVFAAPGPAAPCPLHGPREAQAPAPPQLALLTPAPEAVYALDPDLDPSLQVLACRAQAQGDVSGALWQVNGQDLPPGPEPLRARLALKPGAHELSLTAWGPGGSSRVNVSFLVVGR